MANSYNDFNDYATDEATEAEPEESPSEYGGAMIKGDIHWSSNIVNMPPNQVMTVSGGTTAVNPKQDASESETPSEVLKCHLNYLKTRKAGYEMDLHSLTTQYGEAEKGLNVVTGGIEETEKALKLLDENQIK